MCGEWCGPFGVVAPDRFEVKAGLLSVVADGGSVFFVLSCEQSVEEFAPRPSLLRNCLTVVVVVVDRPVITARRALAVDIRALVLLLNTGLPHCLHIDFLSLETLQGSRGS